MGRGRPPKCVSKKFVWISFHDGGQEVVDWHEIKELVNVPEDSVSESQLLHSEATLKTKPTWIGSIKKIGDDKSALIKECEDYVDANSTCEDDSDESDYAEEEFTSSRKKRPKIDTQYEYFDSIGDSRKVNKRNSDMAVFRKTKKKLDSDLANRKVNKNLQMFSRLKNSNTSKETSSNLVNDDCAEESLPVTTPPSENLLDEATQSKDLPTANSKQSTLEREVEDLESLLLLRDTEISGLKSEICTLRGELSSVNDRVPSLSDMQDYCSIIKGAAISLKDVLSLLPKSVFSKSHHQANKFNDDEDEQGTQFNPIHDGQEDYDCSVKTFGNDLMETSEGPRRTSSPIISGSLENNLPDASLESRREATNKSNHSESAQREEGGDDNDDDDIGFVTLNNNLHAQLRFKYCLKDPKFHKMSLTVGLPELTWQLCIRKSKSPSELAMSLTRALIPNDILEKLSLSATLKGGNFAKSSSNDVSRISTENKKRRPCIAKDIVSAIIDSTKQERLAILERKKENEKRLEEGMEPLPPIRDEKGHAVKEKDAGLWSADKCDEKVLRTAIGRVFRLVRGK